MARQKLSKEDAEKKLSELSGWEITNDKLKKRFEFENFASALAFVNNAGAIAEEKDHHPDIYFGWGYAEFFIITHDAGGLTHNDFTLAKEIDGI